MSLNLITIYPGQIDASDPDGYPYGKAQNNILPEDGVGTPWEKQFVNDLFGFLQEVIKKTAIVPSGTPDKVSASQYMWGLRSISGFPGQVVMYAWNAEPADIENDGTGGNPSGGGLRILPLEGQGIVAEDYIDLVFYTYVGDGNNAAVGAAGGGFYKASDAAGTTPNIAGPYFILPDTRGRFPRGMDAAADVDPDGASRYLGDHQDWSLRRHTHNLDELGENGIKKTIDVDISGLIGGPGTEMIVGSGGTSDQIWANDVIRDETGGPGISSNISDDETRPANFSIRWGIWY